MKIGSPGIFKQACPGMIDDKTAEELDVTLDYGDYLLQAGKVSQEEYERLQGVARECVGKER